MEEVKQQLNILEGKFLILENRFDALENKADTAINQLHILGNSVSALTDVFSRYIDHAEGSFKKLNESIDALKTDTSNISNVLSNDITNELENIKKELIKINTTTNYEDIYNNNMTVINGGSNK